MAEADRITSCHLATISQTNMPSLEPNVPTPQSNHDPSYIQHLPVEVLAVIFHRALRPVDLVAYYKNLYRMISVCKRWADIIEEMSSFWFLIDRHGDALHGATVLSRSKTHPLAIQRHYFGDKDRDKAILDHSSRWKSFSGHLLSNASWGSSDEEQKRIYTIPAPMLQQLTLTHPYDPFDTPILPNIFGGHTPMLQSLHCCSCWPDLSLPVLHQLRVLRLSRSTPDEVHLLDLFRVLSTCDFLSTLELHNCLFHDSSDDNEETMESGQAIILPRLNHLFLRDMDSVHTLVTLTIVSFPQCQTMKLQYDIRDQPPDLGVPVSTEQTAAMPVIKAMINAADVITISFKDKFPNSMLSICTSLEGRTTFDLRLRYAQSPIQSVLSFAEDWELSQVDARITLFVSGLRRNTEDLADLILTLSRLPSITRLVLYKCPSAVIYSILNALSTPYAIPGIQYLWVCPNLEDLLFMECDGYSEAEVLKMLKNRYADEDEHTPPEEGQPTTHCPIRLKRLVLGDVDSGGLHDAIADAAGPQIRIFWGPEAKSFFSESGLENLERDLDESSDWDPDSDAELEGHEWVDDMD